MKLLITGGQSLIAQAIAEARKKQSDQVTLTSSHSEGLEKITNDYGKLNFDLQNPEKFEKEIDQYLSKGIEGLILNATTPSPRLGPLDQNDWQEVQDFLSANINGNMWLLRKVIPIFKEQKFGRIIFISSMTTEYIFPGYAVYASAKAAIESYIKNISVEFGDFNITANTVRLGIFKTNRNKAYWRRDSLREKMEERISLKRLGEPEDVVPTINSLLADQCYIQGATIEISGGLHIPT